MNIKKTIVYFVCFLAVVFSAGCKDVKNIKTTLTVEDNNRHYYPILTGQQLDILFKLKNVGDQPFMLSDIITSCGCITAKKSSIKSIPPGKEGRLILTYNSEKNIGFVQHYITLYGNFATSEKMELVFDVHVVPDALYTKDYEELYQQRKNRDGNVKDLVDGDEQNKGYYMDGDF